MKYKKIGVIVYAEEEVTKDVIVDKMVEMMKPRIAENIEIKSKFGGLGVIKYAGTLRIRTKQ